MDWNFRNIALLPVALLLRAPVLLLAYGLMWLGKRLEGFGGAIPGITVKRRA